MRRGAALLRWRAGAPVAPLRTLLARGGVIAIPSESSYGLAALPGSMAGVEAVYRVKERERGKPLPVVAADVGQLRQLGVDVDSDGGRRAAALWPAALTVVLPLHRPLPAAAAGSDLAVRVPAHGLLRRLLADLGTALTATSANRAGEPPLLLPAEVAELLAGAAVEAALVDAGELPGGPPSTLVRWDADAAGWRVLREGSFPLAALGAPALAAG